MKKHKLQRRKTSDPEIAGIEEDLKTRLGTKVKIIHGKKRGKIEIEYYSKEELDRLIDLIMSLN
jgi:ParB family chromosome partitioning protein